jgi:hypothetical protein
VHSLRHNYCSKLDIFHTKNPTPQLKMHLTVTKILDV